MLTAADFTTGRCFFFENGLNSHQNPFRADLIKEARTLILVYYSFLQLKLAFSV